MVLVYGSKVSLHGMRVTDALLHIVFKGPLQRKKHESPLPISMPIVAVTTSVDPAAFAPAMRQELGIPNLLSMCH